MNSIRTEVKHSQSKNAWNVVGTDYGKKYKIARIPYDIVENDDKTSMINMVEAKEHAIFISECFNNICDSKKA
jgi:hypothetical protein